MGAGLARQLAARGCKTAITARDEEKLAQMVGAAAPDTMLAVPADVTDAAAVEQARDRIADAFGAVPDLVVLNAGMFQPMGADNFSADAFQRHVDVNLMGVARVIELVLPAMLDRGSGQIAIVGSVSGYRGLPKAAAYGPTKAALINLAESLRVELAPRGIVVQIVNPGFVDTAMTEQNEFPMPYLMPVDKAVAALLHGLDRRAFEITFPKRFTWQLKLMRILPYRLYFPVIRRATRSRKS